MGTPDLIRLVSGQNMAWPGTWVQVEVHGLACDVSALLVEDDLRVRDDTDLVFYNHPAAGGVACTPGPPPGVSVDLEELTSPRVLVVLSVAPDDPVLGGTRPRIVFRGPGGPVASFTPTGLTTQRALICCEVYRRHGQWKVRAVGHGYDGGLAAAVRAHGVEVDDEPTAASPASPAPPPSTSPSAAWTGARDPARVVSQVLALFDDASRSAAGLESTLRFAANRLAERTDEVLADRALRQSPAAAAAQDAARAEHDAMVRRATERHDADVAELGAELAQWQHLAPAGVADWNAPAWQAPTWAPQPVALTLGTCHTEHAPHLRIPFLTGLPLNRPLWIRSQPGGGATASRVARAYLLRMLLSHPPGGLRLVTADLEGGSPTVFPPLGGPGCRVQTQPGAVDAAGLGTLLRDLARQVDVRVMAHQNRALDSVPDPVEQLLVVTGFPHGFDETTLGLLELITRHGEMSAVQVILVGEPSEQPEHPLVGLLQERSRCVTCGDHGHLEDRATGVVWRFRPDTGPASDQFAHDLLVRASRGA